MKEYNARKYSSMLGKKEATFKMKNNMSQENCENKSNKGKQ